MEKLKAENIYAMGDTHTLDFLDLLKHYNLQNFILIHLGDAGEGFLENVDRFDLSQLEDYCENHNGRILIVRGNHSNPAYYTDHHWTRQRYNLVTFVKDYTYYDINDSVFLFVGGATSIDRQDRITLYDYWEDEKFVLKNEYTGLPACDVLITHSAPTCASPYDGLTRIYGWFKNDPTLKEELIEERQNIQKLVDHVNPKINLYGHFHETSSERIDGTWFRCLDINEVIDITRDL